MPCCLYQTSCSCVASSARRGLAYREHPGFPKSCPRKSGGKFMTCKQPENLTHLEPQYATVPVATKSAICSADAKSLTLANQSVRLLKYM